MNVVLISCTHRGMFLSRILLSSILFNKNSSELLNITVIGDIVSRDGVRHCIRNMTRPDVEVNLLPLETVSDYERVVIDGAPKQRFKCAYVKLELAFILRNFNHTIYIDTDALMLEDVSNFWHEFRGSEPAHLDDKATIYIARESESIQFSGWTIPKKHYIPPTRLNTGVLFMNLFKLRQQNMTLQNFLAVNDEPDGLADNDILETWAYYNVDKFGLLPCKWNKLLNSGCPDNGKINGIIHGANGNFEKPRFRHLPQAMQDTINFYEKLWGTMCPEKPF